MDKKITKLLGLKKTEFDSFLCSGEISASKATLIPLQKPGDEMALASVILSALRLIKEFRKLVLSSAKMLSSGSIHVYTEVSFSQYPASRVDGMLFVVKGGVIKDAALFEMKNGNNELVQEQIDKYVNLAKTYDIPKLITVSNQFVSEPSQSPLNIRNTNSFSSYHFSWSYLLTMANILLFDNETNISDKDQIEIMKEVVQYLENKKSGVCGFNQMKPGWKSVVEKINSGTRLKITDADVEETVISWQQEEKDLALILSRKLGIYVGSGETRYKGKLRNRIEGDKKKLLTKKTLSSNLKIKGSVSDISISALFEKRIVALSVSLDVPRDKKLRGQIGWIKRQLENCKKKNEEGFARIENEIKIDILLKNTSKFNRMTIKGLYNIYDEIKDKEIKEFRVLYIKDFGKNFASRNKFVEVIEEMLVEYYKKIVQFLTKWEQPAPQIVDKKEADDLMTEDIETKKPLHDELDANKHSTSNEIEHQDLKDWPSINR